MSKGTPPKKPNGSNQKSPDKRPRIKKDNGTPSIEPTYQPFPAELLDHELNLDLEELLVTDKDFVDVDDPKPAAKTPAKKTQNSSGEGKQKTPVSTRKPPTGQKTGSGSIEAILDTVESQMRPALAAETADAAEPKSELRTTSSRDRHVLFSLAGANYALPLSAILEVGRTPVVTHVPNVPNWVAGVTNLRGEILSMVDFRKFLGLDPNPYPSDARMLIIGRKRGEFYTGLIVDKVLGIRNVDKHDLEDPSGLVEEKMQPFIKGVTRSQEKILMVMEMDALINSEEFSVFT